MIKYWSTCDRNMVNGLIVLILKTLLKQIHHRFFFYSIQVTKYIIEINTLSKRKKELVKQKQNKNGEKK